MLVRNQAPKDDSGYLILLLLVQEIIRTEKQVTQDISGLAE
jgi:hypothetical protein